MKDNDGRVRLPSVKLGNVVLGDRRVMNKTKVVVEKRLFPSTGFVLPFHAIYDFELGKYDVLGGSYEQHDDGVNVDVVSHIGLSGSYLYVRIEQDEYCNLLSFAIEADASTRSRYELNTAGTYPFVEFSNILLAEVIGSGDNAVMVQRKHGHFNICIWTIDGYPLLWVETRGGTILPDPA